MKAADLADAYAIKKTIEEEIEEERALLKADECTPVTKDSFFAWKKRRATEK